MGQDEYADKLLMNSRDAARYLAISTRTLFSKKQSGELPYIKCGDRIIRYSIDDLRAYVDAKRKGGGHDE